MKLMTLYLPPSYIKMLDGLVDEGFYPNRAEAIRASIRDLLICHNRFESKTAKHSKKETDYRPPTPEAQAAIERLEFLQSRRTPKRFS